MTLDFVIVGAQKAGTTSLSAALAASPGVHIPRAEQACFETPYFESGGVDALRYHLASRGSYGWRGIKRPNYLGLEVVPPRIAEAFPQCYILVALRNPVARAISAFRHYVEYSHVPFLSVEDGLSRLLDGDDLNSPRAYEILFWGRYRELLLRYLSVFPKAQIVVLGPADLRGDSLRSLRDLEGFPSQPNAAAAASPHRENVGSPSRMSMFLRRAALRQLVLKDPASGAVVGRTSNPARLVTAAGFRRLDAVVHHDPMSEVQWEVSSDVLRRLTDYYRADMEFVNTEFGVELTDGQGRLG